MGSFFASALKTPGNNHALRVFRSDQALGRTNTNRRSDYFLLNGTRFGQ